MILEKLHFFATKSKKLNRFPKQKYTEFSKNLVLKIGKGSENFFLVNPRGHVDIVEMIRITGNMTDTLINLSKTLSTPTQS